jgi:hypothetical protein
VRGAIVPNLFAPAFAQVGGSRSAAQRCALIGDCVTPWPWMYLGNPAEKFGAVGGRSAAGAQRAVRPTASRFNHAGDTAETTANNLVCAPTVR